MIHNILLILIFLLAPALVLWLCRKVPVLGKIGPVLLLYLIGIVVGNVGYRPSAMFQIQDILSSAMVPVAIPLMLFSCTFRKNDTRSQAYALVTGFAAIVITVIAGYLIFGRNIEDGAKVGAMFTGVYTGGTINLASLKAMLSVPEETFILVNSCDMVVCFLYLSFLLSFGIKLFRKFLPNISNNQEGGRDVVLEQKETFSVKGLAVLLGVAALIIALSAAAGLLAGDMFMTVFILVLTTLSIAASFLKFIKCRQTGYDIGMYCIYVFSIVVASMADFSKFDLSNGLNIVAYMTFVIFVSLFLQLLFSKIFKVDADTTLVSSVAYICSPPFVPMIVGATGNRNILASGLAIGVVGYAAGNYLGFLMYQILSLM